MKTAYNKSKIMRNAWYLKSVQPMMSFSECLKKAWRNEKLRIMQRLAEGMPADEPAATTYRPADSPAFAAGCLAYYAEGRNGQYYGD